jgi:hypothetical protein
MDYTIEGSFDEYGFPYLDILVLNKAKDLSCNVKAIIDTGAAHCMVREDIAAQLHLEELRIADYRHPVFGKLPIKEYLMNLSFQDKTQNAQAAMDGIRAGTLLDTNYPAPVIIGVEVLRHCSFEYDGKKQTCRLIINM